MHTFLPKITIITPSFNQGVYIEKTILSIVNQNYPNLEYIIIDGGSTDETLEIIKKHEKHITFWVSEKDNGQAEAINKGIKIATGDILNWINSDDLLEKDALWKIADAYTPDTHCYIGKTHLINNIDEKCGEIHQTNFSGLNRYDCLETGLNQPATFFSRSVIKKIGIINEQFHYSFDLDLWKRFLLNFEFPKVKKLDYYLAEFRIHETSKTNIEKNKSDSKFIRENTLAMNSYFSILPPKKFHAICKILNIESISGFSQPFLNKQIVEKLANELLYFHALSIKKDKGLLFALKYYTLLDIRYIYKKTLHKINSIKN